MTEVIQKVQLIEGKFSPSEANDVITALIGEKINYHKLQSLKIREGNEHANCEYAESRIKELKDEKMIAKEFLKIARKEGMNLRINGTIEISFEQ